SGAPAADDLRIGLRDWFAGCGLVYGALFGIGKLCLGEFPAGIAFLALAVACIWVILRDVERVPRLSLPAAATAALMFALLAIPSSVRADNDKLLSNVKGSVAFESSGKSTPVSPSASVSVADKDI